jgi:GNAT superfamily N-acetyltransferase
LTTVVESDPLDALLEARGYQRVDFTRVLMRDLADARFAAHPAFVQLPRAQWLEAYARIAAVPAAGQQLHALLLAGIRTEHVFGMIANTDGPVACGIAVVERELVGLFDIVTDPDARRHGHARALVESLLGWAASRGAHNAYLQVVNTNEPGRALWQQLGFGDLYHYWYRVAP